MVEQIFHRISDGDIEGVSSYLTLLEVLVRPIQAGHLDIARKYKGYMLDTKNLNLYPLDIQVAEKAAQLRAKYHGNGFKLKTPDAIQIATGLLKGAQAFVTNDCKLKSIKEIDVIVLDELIH